MKISALEYHRETSYDRRKMGGHYLDWQNQPSPFKNYPGIDPVPLPRGARPPGGKLSSLLKETGGNTVSRPMDREDLSLILRLANGHTAKITHRGKDFFYRSAASAGALYPTEIYVATRSVEGMDDGLYHFAVHHHGLTLIRNTARSDHTLGETQPGETGTPALTFFLSAIIFRSSWKYRDRSYRYHLLDTGHVIENLILALKSLSLPFELSYDFEDKRVNRFLGVDETRELSLALVHVPEPLQLRDIMGKEMDDLPDAITTASRVSREETPYPLIHEIHNGGIGVVSGKSPRPPGLRELGIALEHCDGIARPARWPETTDFPEAVSLRRSSRNFIAKPMNKDCFLALLDCLCADDPVKWEGAPPWESSVCTGFLVGNVEGFSPGLYLLNTQKKSTGLVASGNFMETMTRICLDQQWLAGCAVHFLFMVNLESIDRAWGSRGYRYAMMSAGRMGERLYLAATAMGMGCCGIGAFYDSEAAGLLQLNEETRLLYLVAAGPVKSLMKK